MIKIELFSIAHRSGDVTNKLIIDLEDTTKKGVVSVCVCVWKKKGGGGPRTVNK